MMPDQFASGQHFIDQLAPCQLGRRQRAAIFAGGFLNMTRPAENLKAVQVEGVLVRLALQRGYMVAFQFPSFTAHYTPPLIALEDGPADDRPAAGIHVGVAAAHAIVLALRDRT